MSEKTQGQLLSEKLTYKSENAFETLSEKEITAAYDYAVGY